MKSAIEFGKKLGKSKEESKLAYEKGYQKLEEFHELTEDGILVPDALYKIYPFDKYPNYKFKKRRQPKLHKEYEKNPLSLMVLGHPYNTYEPIINHGLMDILKSNFVDIITVENAPEEIFSRTVEIDDNLSNFWDNEDELMALSDYVINNEEIDGGIFLISFACGPDSLIQEVVMQDFDMKNKPFIDLTLDEHTGESQLKTRVESFIEMIRRKKYK
jgi:predicted nucleotide-binding protein (sugar kinase/HSP70/actin superfamily)